MLKNPRYTDMSMVTEMEKVLLTMVARKLFETCLVLQRLIP